MLAHQRTWPLRVEDPVNRRAFHSRHRQAHLAIARDLARRWYVRAHQRVNPVPNEFSGNPVLVTVVPLHKPLIPGGVSCPLRPIATTSALTQGQFDAVVVGNWRAIINGRVLLATDDLRGLRLDWFARVSLQSALLVLLAGDLRQEPVITSEPAPPGRMWRIWQHSLPSRTASIRLALFTPERVRVDSSQIGSHQRDSRRVPSVLNDCQTLNITAAMRNTHAEGAILKLPDRHAIPNDIHIAISEEVRALQLCDRPIQGVLVRNPRSRTCHSTPPAQRESSQLLVLNGPETAKRLQVPVRIAWTVARHRPARRVSCDPHKATIGL